MLVTHMKQFICSEGIEFVEHELLWHDRSFLNFSSIPLGGVWKDEIRYPSDRRDLLWRSFSELPGCHIRSHSQFSCKLILLKHLFLLKLISMTRSGQLSSHKLQIIWIYAQAMRFHKGMLKPDFEFHIWPYRRSISGKLGSKSLT